MTQTQHLNQHGIIDLLKSRGERITKNRREVINALCTKNEPLSVKDLEDALPNINIVTVYRILEYLKQQGIVSELTHDPKEKYFELADPYHQHHHHAVCRNCNKVLDIQCELTIPEIPNFEPDGHVVTVFGRCKKC